MALLPPHELTEGLVLYAVDDFKYDGWREWKDRTFGFWQACPKDNCTAGTTRVLYGSPAEWISIQEYNRQREVDATINEVIAQFDPRLRQRGGRACAGRGKRRSMAAKGR